MSRTYTWTNADGLTLGGGRRLPETSTGEKAIDKELGPVNVRFFGAVGDGNTDDTAAIQAAEDYASARSLSVRFPAGVYLCAGALYRRGNTDWIGDGMYQSIIKHSGGAALHHLVHTTTATVEYSHIGFYGLGFDGNRSGSTSPDIDRIVVFIDRNPDGLNNAPSSDVRFIGCRLFNFSYSNMGLHIKGYTGVQIKDSVFDDGGGNLLYHPVYLRRCADVVVQGNTVQGRSTNTCIKVQLSPGTTISGNICRDGGRGITVQDSSKTTVTGNVVTGQTEYGIICSIETLTDSLDLAITGNSISSAATGIVVSNAGFFAVTGNVITEFTYRGIYFRSARDGVCNSNTLRTADATASTIDFVWFEAGPIACRMACNSNHLRSIRSGGGVSRGFVSDEVDVSGLALLGNTFSGTFAPEFSGISSLLTLPAPGQIRFPAVQNASTNANTLDHYEEGVFTPTSRGSTSAGTGTYTTQVGRFSKIGRRVFFQLHVVWTAHTGTGFLRLDGLPFTSNSVANALSAVSIGYVSNIATTAGTFITGVVSTNSTQILLYETPTGGGVAGLVNMDVAGEITVSGHYEALA